MALEGRLNDFDLADLFQLIGLGQRTGCIDIECSVGDGHIYFENGYIVHAFANTLEDEKAVYEMFNWDEGKFIFLPDKTTLKTTMMRDWQSLILEAARRSDEMMEAQRDVPEEIPAQAAVDKEWADIKDELPPLSSLIVRDTSTTVSAQLTEIEKDVLARLSKPVPLNIFLDDNIHKGKFLIMKTVVSLHHRRLIKIVSEYEASESKEKNAGPDDVDQPKAVSPEPRVHSHSHFNYLLVEFCVFIGVLLIFFILFSASIPEKIPFAVQRSFKVVKPEVAQNIALEKTKELLIVAAYSDPSVLGKLRLNDGWGTPLKIVNNTIVSAGPDVRFGTNDDIMFQK